MQFCPWRKDSHPFYNGQNGEGHTLLTDDCSDGPGSAFTLLPLTLPCLPHGYFISRIHPGITVKDTFSAHWDVPANHKNLCCNFRLIKAVNWASDCKSYSPLLCTLSKIISFYDTLPKSNFIPPNLPLARKQPSLDWAILQSRLLSCRQWDMTHFWGKEPVPPTLATQNASSTILRD